MTGENACFSSLLRQGFAEGDKLAVAISGGPDSLALLLLAHAAFGARVVALTVDHGLRAEAVIEAEAVARRAVSLGVPHATLRWAGPHPAANLQAAARAARYRLMGGWCAVNGVRWLATAHHRDDQAETLLLRLARGSGSGGLAGIRAVRPLVPGVTLVRPLLGMSKAALAEIVAAAGWTAADDRSNRDPRFDRTAARAALAATSWLDPARLAAAAAHLAEVEAALAWTAELAWAGHAEVAAGEIVLDAAGLPRALARRLVLRAVTTLAPGASPDGPAVTRLLDRLGEGGGGTLAGVAARARDSGGTCRWRFRRAPPRR